MPPTQDQKKKRLENKTSKSQVKDSKMESQSLPKSMKIKKKPRLDIVLKNVRTNEILNWFDKLKEGTSRVDAATSLHIFRQACVWSRRNNSKIIIWKQQADNTINTELRGHDHFFEKGVY